MKKIVLSAIIFFGMGCDFFVDFASASLINYNNGQTNEIDFNWTDWAEDNLSGTIELVGPPGRVVVSVSDLDIYQQYRPVDGCIEITDSPSSISTIANFTFPCRISDISVYGDSCANIQGGTVVPWVMRSTSEFYEIKAYDSSNIYIYGTNFNLPLGEIVSTQGLLTGTLEGGQDIDVQFYRESGASIILVPEPSTLLLFSLCFYLLRKSEGVK